MLSPPQAIPQPYLCGLCSPRPIMDTHPLPFPLVAPSSDQGTLPHSFYLGGEQVLEPGDGRRTQWQHMAEQWGGDYLGSHETQNLDKSSLKVAVLLLSPQEVLLCMGDWYCLSQGGNVPPPPDQSATGGEGGIPPQPISGCSLK